MKHINLTNFEGSITDWTELNYIAGGMEDDVASLANQTGNKLSKDENGDWQIKDSNGDVIWPAIGPDASDYKFEDVTLPTAFAAAENYQTINSFCSVISHSTSTKITGIFALDTSLTADIVAAAAGYDRKFRFLKTDVLKYDVTNCTNFYIKCQSGSSKAITLTISNGVTTTSVTTSKLGEIKTCTFPCSNFTGSITITGGTEGNYSYFYELGYTKE